MGFKFVLTNEIKKASLIIGLKKHLKQNFKLTNLAKQKNIPIYGLNQVKFFYQDNVKLLFKFVKFYFLSKYPNTRIFTIKLLKFD
jgi:hypothetical protein